VDINAEVSFHENFCRANAYGFSIANFGGSLSYHVSYMFGCDVSIYTHTTVLRPS